MSRVTEIVNRCISIGDEQEWFEFKQGTAVSKPDDIGEYISALSNAAVVAGEPYGYMIWGVHDKTHELTDTKFNYQKDINNEPFQHYLSRYVSPAINFHFDEDTINGNRIVVLSIPAARIVPTAYKEERFIRIGSSKEKLKKYPDREAALFHILSEIQNPTDNWESGISKYHISDINKTVFDRYLQKAKGFNRITITSDDPAEVLNGIGLAEGDQLLNAGAALFVDSGMNELQMAKFASDERLTFLDINRQTGCILALADIAVQYISEAMDWRVEFDGSLERKEIPEVPVNAIREAVVNAFAHRMIESRQAVEVAIYKSYIDIYSPGVFPTQVNPEQFIQKQLKPIRRNPIITTSLYYSKDMESFATGLRRINEECKGLGVKFEFIREPYGFTVRFHRHSGGGWRKLQPASEKGSDENTISHSDEKTDISPNRLIEILEFCNEPRTRIEIQEFCGYKSVPHFRERILRPLLVGEYLILTVPDKPNSPKQKYIRRTSSKA